MPAISGTVSLLAGIYIVVQPWDLSDSQFLIIGFVSLVAGILLIRGPGTAWIGVVGLLLFGCYMMARGMGWLNHQYLRYGLGLGLIIFGALLLAQVVKSSSDGSVNSDPKPPVDQS